MNKQIEFEKTPDGDLHNAQNTFSEISDVVIDNFKKAIKEYGFEQFGMKETTLDQNKIQHSLYFKHPQKIVLMAIDIVGYIYQSSYMENKLKKTYSNKYEERILFKFPLMSRKGVEPNDPKRLDSIQVCITIGDIKTGILVNSTMFKEWYKKIESFLSIRGKSNAIYQLQFDYDYDLALSSGNFLDLGEFLKKTTFENDEDAEDRYSRIHAVYRLKGVIESMDIYDNTIFSFISKLLNNGMKPEEIHGEYDPGYWQKSKSNFESETDYNSWLYNMENFDAVKFCFKDALISMKGKKIITDFIIENCYTKKNVKNWLKF